MRGNASQTCWTSCKRRAALHKTVRLEEMYPIIQQVLEQGGTFSLTITGTSMWPTLLGGRDQVTIAKAPNPLKRYDLPLYRRPDGRFLLHRILRVEEDGSYACCGDHQWTLETELQQENMIGLVTEFVRKGKHHSVEERGYRLWVRFWAWVLPLRHTFFSIHSCYRSCGSFILRKVLRIPRRREAGASEKTEA